VNRTIRRTLAAATVAGTALTLAATALGASTGSGASFPALVYTDWCRDSGLCSYTSKGSTGGINDFIAGSVDFAATDAPLTSSQSEQLAAKRGGVKALYFPTLLGAISVPVNAPGLTKRLQLNGPTLADIFSGGITTWNDAKIKKDNPGVALPSQPITVCVRADGSGTSFGFTTFLTKVSPTFGSKVGASQQPNWTAPKIVRGTRNPGVAQCIKDNQFSIGYVDLGDATNAGLGASIAKIGKTETIVIKRKGKPVKQTRVVYSVPSGPGITKAGDVAKVDLTRPDLLQFQLANSKTAGAYPITITTFVLAYSDYSTAGKGGSLGDVKSLLGYAYGTGQGRVANFGFAPLPKPLLDAGKAQLALLKQ
jgi:phosphate transport system substrate-binding protein